jgi:hypothetical protein
MLAKIVAPFIQSTLIVGLLLQTACNSGEGQGEKTATETKDSTGTLVADEGDPKGFKKIFDGKTLTGWEGDTAYWHVEDGTLTGQITPDKLLKTNSFIVWQGGEPGDFELTAEFKITASGNSGINYRSEPFPGVPHALKGYQADIDGANSYTGQNYEERGRTTLAYRGQKTTIPAKAGESKNNAWSEMVVDASLGSSDSLKSLIKAEDWNKIHLIIKGNHLQHFVNDVLMSDVTDNDAEHSKAKGLLGVQVHVGPPMKVQYRNIMLKQL